MADAVTGSFQFPELPLDILLEASFFFKSQDASVHIQQWKPDIRAPSATSP